MTSTLDKRTWTIDGEVLESDIEAQKIVVRTSHGEILRDVPIASPSLSTRDKSGIHSFPRKGDKCWLTRDVDRWYVSSFGPALDLTGNFTAQRPALFRAGGQHVHSDLSGVDVLPSFSAGGQRLYALEKLGVTIEDLSAGLAAGSSGSSTTAAIVRAFDGSAIARTVIPGDGCSESISNFFDPAFRPRVTSVSPGAILLDKSLTSMPDVTVTIRGENFDKIMDMALATDKRVKVSVSDGFPPTLISLSTATSSGPATPGTVTLIVKRVLSGSPQTPDGVFDIVLANPTTGDAIRVVGALSINSFTPGVARRTFFSVPSGMYIGFTRDTGGTPNVGAVFAVRSDVRSVLLQETQSGNATTDNSKYVGSGTGPFPDFMALFDGNGEQQDTGFLNGLRSDSLTLTQIETLPTPDLKFTIVGIGADQAASNAITSRLTSASQRVTVFSSDSAKKNLGIEVDNFQFTDKFRIEVYLETDNAAPDYSLPPRIDSMEPASIQLPRTLFLAIHGENFRVGTDFTLVQNTRLVDIGLPTERFEPVTGSFPQISLGLDTSSKPRNLALFNGGGNSISGSVMLYRISDKLIGMRLSVTDISPGLLGEYNLVAIHSVPDHNPSSAVKVLTIRPFISSSSSGSTGGPSRVNTYLQTVKARNSEGTDRTLFQYGVDENGRLDIRAAGGVYFDGSPAQLSASLIGRISASAATSTSIVADLGDASMVAVDGNILIAALRANPADKTRGDVHIHAAGCVTVGHGAETVNVGRRAQRAQFGTQCPVVQVGGDAGDIIKRFPDSFKAGQLPLPTTPTNIIVNSYVAVGPLLIPDESHSYTGQVSITEPSGGGAPQGFSSTFFALRHRASTTAGKILEGRINLVFMPDGRGTGTDADPYTGTWHIPLAGI